MIGTPAARVTGFWVAYFAILIGAGRLRGMVPGGWGPFVWGATSSLALLLVTLWLLKREGRSPRTVGLPLEPRSWPRLFGGLALGLALYAAILLVDRLLAGPLTLSPDPTASWTGAALAVATFLALSAMEELGFRGYPLRTLVPVIGLWPAQFLVAVAFGLAHLAYGWSWSSILLGVIPSALLFGIVATRSGGLAAPIGVHAGVNLAAWMVGMKETPGLWTIHVETATQGRLATIATVMSIGMTLLLTALLAWRHPPDRP